MNRSLSCWSRPTLVLLLAALLPWIVAELAGAEEATPETPPPAALSQFVSDHCLDCHQGRDAEAQLDLSELSWNLADGANFDRWTLLLDRVTQGSMPPQSEQQPSSDDRTRFVTDLRDRLVTVNRARQAELGRTTLRRLNRGEYERTVQELLGINRPLAHLLPDETPLHGFDTVSDGLRFSALHIDKYLAAADAALDEAIRLTERPQHVHERFRYTEQEGIRRNLNEDKPIVRDIGEAVVLFADASYINRIHGLHLASAGRYRIRARAWAYQSEGPVILRLHAGNWQAGSTRVLGFFDVLPDEPREVEVTVWLEQGEYLYPAPDDLSVDAQGQGVWHHGGKEYQGEGLAIEWMEVEGPLEPNWPPASVGKVFGSTPIIELERPEWQNGQRIAYAVEPTSPRDDIANVVADFAQRAFRRPLGDDESAAYIQLAQQALDAGQTYEDAVRLGLRAILTSPQFLILREEPGRLDDAALACRLSYFLWGTQPDEELRELAGQGKLSEPQVVRAQTQRLLADSRSDFFVHSFVDQWLDLRRIDATTPDAKLYPEFDELLKLSMLAETHEFFRKLIDEDLSADHLVASEFAMLNRRLAEHYQIEGVHGQQLQWVKLPPASPRGGILTQASVLKVTANGTVTSPVTRGSWVMTKLLNQPPPPPPPAVGSIEPDTRGATTVREQLNLHRRDPSCAGCHALIDPPGFALESFDVIGGWRDRYRSNDQGDPVQEKLHGRNIWEYKLGPAVDASGELPDGRVFAGIEEFKSLLLEQREQIAASLIANLLVYATGHRIELADREVVTGIIEQTRPQEFGLRSLIHAIVQSETFQSK